MSDRRLKNQIEDPNAKNAKERLYDKIPITVKQLDVIIVCLVIAFVVVLVLGILKKA